jgi:hypothetical protein
VRATAVLAAFRTDSPVNIDLSVPVWTIEHVAAALHCSVDAAREHTYRADFPRPRAGFSKNLWTRTEVLAWFDALPPRPPGRAGNGAVSTATVARTAARPAWGALAVELGSGSGPRWGEEFQLTAYDVHLSGCCRTAKTRRNKGGKGTNGSRRKKGKKDKGKFRPHIHIDWQIDPAATADDPNGRRCLPKGDKRRSVAIPKKTFTGYPLRAQLAKRVGNALKEQSAGTNPEALLFPAEGGGLQWYTSFSSDLLHPAMDRAGWPLEHSAEVRDEWSQQTRSYTRVERKRTIAHLPWHSLRHRFARWMIGRFGMEAGEVVAVGGWENIATRREPLLQVRPGARGQRPRPGRARIVLGTEGIRSPAGSQPAGLRLVCAAAV